MGRDHNRVLHYGAEGADAERMPAASATSIAETPVAGQSRPSPEELQVIRPLHPRTGRPTSCRGIRPTRVGAQFDPLLSFEAWGRLGVTMAKYSNATAWWLGDWMAFGRMKYGRRYKDAIAETGLDYQTLRNYAVVARRFELSRRRYNLTFQHHAALCSRPDDEQDYWLDRAAAGDWSRGELRRRLRAADRSDPPPAQCFRLTVELGRARSWRDAAKRSNSDVEDWIVKVLDDAANAAVGRDT